MTDGLHTIPAAEYFAIPAISHSQLKAFSRTPAHAYELLIHPPEPSAAMKRGTAVHAAILEPDVFRKEYVVAPKVDRRTNAGKAAWAAFEVENAGKELVSADDWEMYLAMQTAAWANPIVRELLGNEDGLNECAVVWTDPETGEKCKGRMDRLTRLQGMSVVLDIKTCPDASEWAFARTAVKFGHHTQAAWYLDGLNVLHPYPRAHITIAIEDQPPYCTAVWQMDLAALQLGQVENRKRLSQYIACKKANDWPGYPQKVMPLALPNWAFKAGEQIDE